MDLIGPSVLDRAESVRKTVVDFRAYTASNLITESEQAVITEYIRAPNKTEFLDAKALPFFTAFVRLYAKTVKPETLAYFVTLLDDAVQINDHIRNLVAAGTKLGINLVDVFFSPFDKQERDPYILHMNARMLTRLAGAGLALPARELRVFTQWLASTVQAGEAGSCELALVALQRLLARAALRPDIHAVAVQALVTVLSLENRVQAQYQAVFCLWELAFDASLVPLLAESPAVLKVGSILRAVRKEKLARVCLAFLRNLMEKMDSTENKRKLATTLISQKVLQTVDEFVKQKTFQDEEIVADCEYLAPQLSSFLESMTSFEEYRAEVLSGQLEWSPVHRSERFWRDNINNINDRHGELVKALARYLETAPTFLSLAIAIHDLGQYVRFYPRGKTLLESLGAKAAIVGFMEHQDAAVRYEALVATQKVLTQNWEFLGQKLAKSAQEEKQRV